MAAPSTVYRDASLSEAQQIVEVTNDAFAADMFFKKPAYYSRFALEDVQRMIQAPQSVFIVAVRGEEVLGSLFLHWEAQGEEVLGKFSAVSVPGRHGKQGIGKGLVQAAERRTLQIAREAAAGCRALLQMGVINLRADLFPWYQGQGFAVIGEVRPNDPELELITLDSMRGELCMVLMQKDLLVVPSSSSS